jgi:hypothetical protein
MTDKSDVAQGRENDFTNFEKIGRGGFASVYKCVHKIDKNPYALKKIKVDSGGDMESVGKIYSEVKQLSSLDHSNIVRYYGCWMSNQVDQSPLPRDSVIFDNFTECVDQQKLWPGSGNTSSGGCNFDDEWNNNAPILMNMDSFGEDSSENGFKKSKFVSGQNSNNMSPLKHSRIHENTSSQGYIDSLFEKAKANSAVMDNVIVDSIDLQTYQKNRLSNLSKNSESFHSPEFKPSL